MPIGWTKEGMTQEFMSMLRNLDPSSSGFIDHRQMLTYFILLVTRIPNEQEAALVNQIADADGCIGEEAFLKAAFWFEHDEQSKERDHHEHFDRSLLIKKELFRANA